MKYVISAGLWIMGGLYFIAFLCCALLLSLAFKPSTINPLLQRMLKIFFILLGCKVHVEGLHNIDLKNTYIYMANHVSMFDIPFLGAFLPGLVRGIEANRQHKWPLYGVVMRRLGNIPIDRENPHRAIRSLAKAADSMTARTSIVILPEGHRSEDGKLLPFKKMPFHFAKQVGRPLVPVAMCGLLELKRKGNWVITPSQLTLKIGRAITVKEIEYLSVLDLRDLTQDRILELLK